MWLYELKFIFNKLKFCVYFPRHSSVHPSSCLRYFIPFIPVKNFYPFLFGQKSISFYHWVLEISTIFDAQLRWPISIWWPYLISVSGLYELLVNHVISKLSVSWGYDSLFAVFWRYSLNGSNVLKAISGVITKCPETHLR